MPPRVTVISLLIFLCSLQGAYAAGDRTVEIKAQQGLILLENFQQWLGLTYQYNAHDSGKPNSGSSSSKLEEIYHIDTTAAILDPHLLNMNLGVDIWLQQVAISSDTSGSSSGQGVKYQYSFAASAFDRKWYPINVFSSRSLDTVQSPFSPSINTDTARNGIEFLILKAPYRLKFKYERNSLDLSGGNQNSSQVSDSFEALVNHSFRDISFTGVNATFSTQESVTSGSRQTGTAYSFGYSNALFMGRLKNYSLTSTLQSSNATTAGLPQQSVNLTESFAGHLGKALDLDLNYRYDHNRTASQSNQDQVYDANSLLFQIRHRLFESLSTRLRANASLSEFLGGSEEKYSGTAGLTYRKKLFAGSQLMVDAYGTHEVTDRKLGASEQVVLNERTHSVTQLNQVITLDIAGPLKVGSVTIQGFAVPPINPQLDPPTLTFIENLDYQIDYPLGRITWIGLVPTVPNIVVAYTVQFDPSVKYSTDTVSLSSSLSLAEGRYAFSGLIYNQTQQVLSGQAQLGLFDTRIAQLRFQAFAGENTYNLEYSDYASGRSKYRYLEGWWQYNHVAPIMSLQVIARDRYTMYDATNTAGGYTDNSLNVSASYSRDITDWARAMLTLNVVDQRGKNGTSDSVSLRATIRARFNRLTVTLLGSSGLRRNENSTNRDDYIRVELKRYF